MYLYAAYNAAPSGLAEDAATEGEWYRLLRGEPLIRGLELSYNGGLHPGGAEHLVGMLDPAWQNVVTNIPGTIANLGRDSAYGLASRDDRGRADALEHVRGIHRSVRELQALLGERTVIAVELHSAPLAVPGASSAERLAHSLAEIASWEWGEVRLVLEHADALTVDHPPQKGWLSLDAEMDAVATASERSGRRIVHGINWGRSAIETRSHEGPLRQIEALVAANALGALMISGASGSATERSEPWEDVHLPLATVEPASILTVPALAATLAAAASAPLDYLGIKVGRPPHPTTLEERLAPGLATLRALDSALG